MVALEAHDETECDFKPLAPPTFAVDDIESATLYLNEHGYCVFRDVATEDDIHEFKRLLKSDFMNSNASISKETDLEDFTEDMISTNDKGLSSTYCHGKAAWAARLHPPVRRVFSHLLGVKEDEMVSSFDCLALSIRGAKHGTNQWWGHVDHAKYANAEGKKLPCADISAFQSSLYLTDCTHDESASFVAVPGSHHAWAALAEQQLRKAGGVFCCPRCASKHWLPAERAQWAPQARKLRLPRGALLVWNSRLIHQSAAPAPPPPQEERKGFSRIAFMVSYGRVRDRTAGAEERMLAMLLKGHSSNSWPQLAQTRPENEERDEEEAAEQRAEEEGGGQGQGGERKREHRRLVPELRGGLAEAALAPLLPLLPTPHPSSTTHSPSARPSSSSSSSSSLHASLRRLPVDDLARLGAPALRALLPPRLLQAVPPSHPEPGQPLGPSA